MLFALLQVAPAKNRDSCCPGFLEAEKSRGGSLGREMVQERTEFIIRQSFS